jgi:hypothetical protein
MQVTVNPAALAAALIKKPYMRRWAGQGFTIAPSRQPRRSPGPLVPPRLTSDTLSSLQNDTQQIFTHCFPTLLLLLDQSFTANTATAAARDALSISLPGVGLIRRMVPGGPGPRRDRPGPASASNVPVVSVVGRPVVRAPASTPFGKAAVQVRVA